ncbi:MAG: MaoC family dehydratase [Woeseia sp.]
MAKHYFEDFKAGQTFFGSSRLSVDKADILRFAAEFDPQPFHLDEEAAKNSLFGALAASGWHTSAMTMRLLVDSQAPVAGGLIGLGVEDLRWPLPVRAGDTLRVEFEILGTRESKSRPQQGLVRMQISTFNQRDEIVQRSVNTIIVPRRTFAAAAEQSRTSGGLPSEGRKE